jgi:hypothetical protein
VVSRPWRRGPARNPHPLRDAVKPGEVELFLDTSCDIATSGCDVGASLACAVGRGQE